MAKKRTSLDTILPASKPKPASKLTAKPLPGKEKMPQPERAEQGKPVSRRPNFKQPALYLKHPVHRQIRVLAFEEEKKMHDLFLEAIDMLFADRGLPSIVELESEERE